MKVIVCSDSHGAFAAAEQLLDGRLKRGDTARVVAGDRTVRVEREAPAAT